MLSTDLRNYEKAETVLRRRVLDHHVNDKDGMLALGDVYMDWADEDPDKYGDAVKIYSRLIELYGENDTFLLRMMRYFIRTDNLAEVLNLKDHFSSRITKIGAANLTELSGYLLEKRYNPQPLDSEKLRAKIDDVRMLLEKAVQTDKTMPEAYYNLGRFFIYNNKQDGAIENLTEAIKLFETAAPMTARRTVRYVDAMRLLGEQLVEQKK
ncbi:tetratricopeptide repeat protein [Treponema vincentii ATCC 35580]|uniref:Tetratricopeptide repeat protein n=1 Tax=Treponema vincentii ATCC 35580 TaxID=596324 RepID=C8PR06_9SPIR|nr:tetratricopeptide repeat protein [Treponema vincentii]EEV20110.1 tetratricopeptide repeat protein [Treponema vincentii ATCC 35580]